MKISRYIMMLFALTMFLLVTSPVAVLAGDTTGKATYANPDELQWGNAPSSLPPGMQVSVLFGDPAKPGPFVLRFRTAGEYRIPPHYHSRAETLTVLSGTFYLGSGEEFDPVAAHPLGTGGFHFLPSKTPHFGYSKTPTIVEIHGEGPFDINYIHPEDDPRSGR